MQGIIEIQLGNFLLIYLLLLLVTFIMRRCKINQTRLLFLASLKMTVQLVIAGQVLTFIFQEPSPVFTILYFTAMVCFAIHRVLSQNSELNRRFKLVIAASILFSGLFILVYFMGVVVGVKTLNPQYVIPISGMVIGNAMTGVSLAVKTFRESLKGQQNRIHALLCMGASPAVILRPFVQQSLETAMLPTMNSMLGMGIVSLPGMMTGQILSGTLPTTAILYQIAIMVAICAAVALACFASLFLGYKTLYDEKTEIIEIV